MVHSASFEEYRQSSGGEASEGAAIDADMIHSVSHAMRTPLTSIGMCADALTAAEDDRAAKKYGGIIADQAKIITWLIDDMLAVADRDLYKEAVTEELNAVRLCENAVAPVRELSQMQSITLKVEWSNEKLTVYGVDEALQQVIRNCALALVHALPANSDVTIAAVSDDHPEGDCNTTKINFRGQYPVKRTDTAGNNGGDHSQRISRLAVETIVAEHDGQLTEAASAKGLRITVSLPAA